MAFIGSLTVTGSSTSTVKKGEARWIAAGNAGSTGSIGLVLQSGDYGNAQERDASGSIVFVSKNGGSTLSLIHI